MRERNMNLVSLVQVFKKLGDAGLLGVNKPVEYGGMGLNFK